VITSDRSHRLTYFGVLTAKVILSTDLRNLLQLHLAPAPISDPSAPATSHKIPSTGPTDDARKLYVSTLAQKGHLRLLKLDVAVPECGKVEAEAWIARAMRAAYPGELRVGATAGNLFAADCRLANHLLRY
jgi:hypothetical protein